MSVIEGRSAPSAVIEDEADVVVVGSGASGAVIAKEMAADGRSVILVEEGPWYTPEDKAKFTHTEAMMRLFRAGGGTMAVGKGNTPVISNLLGWGAGGSSTITGGVCFRTPDKVLNGWARDLGLTGLAPDPFMPYFEEVERDLDVRETPEGALSHGARMFRGGAEALGYEVRRTPRNMTGCRGASRCNFVCPIGAKNSVDRVYIPQAMDNGARLYCDALATDLCFDGDRASGVRGRLLGEGMRKVGRFHFRAKVVVLAMGAVHTAQFMRRNGIGASSGLVGRGMTIHPSFRAYGVFPDEVRAGLGAMQGIYSPSLMDRGVSLIAIMTPPGAMGANVPGFGSDAREYMEKRKHIMAFGAMVHDRDEGRVMDVPGREPLMLYTIGREAKQLFIEAAHAMARIFFEAGATEALMHFPPFERFKSPEELVKMQVDTVQWKLLECASYHPLGTVRMGSDPARSVVDPTGRVWEHPNLFVVDGGAVPTHIGVNSQMTIMALALKLARGMRDDGATLFA